MNTWNTLLESYQQMVYENTLATVKRQIHWVENAMHAIVTSVEAQSVDNANLLDYVTSEVAREEPEIESTDPNILRDNNCSDDEMHFRGPGGHRDHEVEGNEGNIRDAIPTASLRRKPVTKLKKFDMKTSDVNGYEGKDGDYVDADDVREALQGNDGSTQNVEYWGHSRFDLGTNDVDGYECDDGDDADADVEEEASQVDDWSKQNVEA